MDESAIVHLDRCPEDSARYDLASKVINSERCELLAESLLNLLFAA